jgi:hypothetical protein
VVLVVGVECECKELGAVKEGGADNEKGKLEGGKI